VKAVLFDLDDTLIPERVAIEAGYAAVAERVWGASSPERISSLWQGRPRVRAGPARRGVRGGATGAGPRQLT
jgi:FMN phosphatase YigB (HAD superfamily)